MGIMEILFIVGLLTLSIMFPVVMGRIALVGGLIILGLCIILVGGCFTVIGAGIDGIGTIVLGVMCILAGLGIDSAFESHGLKKDKEKNSITCKPCGTVVPNGYLYCSKCGKELNKEQAIVENSSQPQEIKQETSENSTKASISEIENQEQPSGDNIGVVTSKVADKYRVWMNNNIWTAVSSDILAVGDKVELVSADNSAFMIVKRISSQPQGMRQRTSENSIICKTCNTVVPNGYQYCSKCGKELNK